MKNSRILAAISLALVSALTSTPPVRAQMSSSPPLVVKQRKAKPVWMKAEIIHADSHSLMVREQANSLNIHTFTYADKAQRKIGRILDAGGYQVGDKVKVLWMSGGSEALDIKGKPSKGI
jgi:hypothetical protein